MKRLSSIAAALLLSCSPVCAGLGPATESNSGSDTYNAWCGERGNDCTVSFKGGKITVNGTHSVNFEDITYITRGSFKIHLITFGIEYIEDGMAEPEFSEILFQNVWAAEKFWRDLKRACRDCKDRDGVQVDVNVNQ